MALQESLLKLFIVTKTESGWGWSNDVWVKYFLSNDRDTVMAVLRDRYGNLDQYHYDEEETHITVEEAEVEIFNCTKRKHEREDEDW